MPLLIQVTQELALTGSGGAWLAAHAALVVADVHLGYARAARRRGGWLPAGETADTTAARLVAAAAALGAGHVVIAGDLRHSTRDADDAELADVRRFLALVGAACRVTLLLGNHDRGGDRLYAGAGAEVVRDPLPLGDVLVTHAPPTAPPERWTVCGHLHPSVDVRDETGAGARFPCALVGPRVVVLPAFGTWAGGVRAGRLRRTLFPGPWLSYPISAGELFGPIA